MQTSRCRSCGAAIIWAKTPAGKTMPIDAEPTPYGNIALVPAGAIVLTKDLADQGRRIGSKLYRSHFVSCPHAAKHRKAREGQDHVAG